MKKLTLIAISALALAAQTPASITVTVVDNDGVTSTAVIDGDQAKYGLESLTLWMATQKDPECKPDGQPDAAPCKAQYQTPADFAVQHLIRVLAPISEKFPSSATRQLREEIATKIAQLEAMREALMKPKEEVSK